MTGKQEGFGVSRPRTSYVDVSTPNSFGTTNSNIRVFTKIERWEGGAIRYLSDPALGDKFIIVETGVYSITYDDGGTNPVFGISINVNGNAAIGDLNNANPSNGYVGKLAVCQQSNVTCAWTGPLNAGDFLKAHCLNFSPSNGDQQRFRICKVA
jgi:hypothetical protein